MHSSATRLNENEKGPGEPNDGLIIYRHHHPSSRVCCRSSPAPSALWAQSPGAAQGAGHWCCATVLPAGALCQCQAPQGTAAPGEHSQHSLGTNWAAPTLFRQTKCCFLHQQAGWKNKFPITNVVLLMCTKAKRAITLISALALSIGKFQINITPSTWTGISP